MENATKALLIAAAVLVAIIIISLTLTIVRQGQEAIAGADMTEAQIEAFNSKFKTYEGSNVSTAQVNALLNAALSSNLTENTAETGRTVTVTVDGDTKVSETSNSIDPLTGSNYYKVSITYRSTGLIESIAVTSPNYKAPTEE